MRGRGTVRWLPAPGKSCKLYSYRRTRNKKDQMLEAHARNAHTSLGLQQRGSQLAADRPPVSGGDDAGANGCEEMAARMDDCAT
jgi:hypothetical protein